MQAPIDTVSSVDWFKPTTGRFLFALLLAAIGFILPQEVPLVWYPLNEPGNEILYLEISCASDKDGDVQIFYNLTQGINQLDSIYFPISPTKQTFTYTFPLPDAPITELRIDPVAKGGTLTIRQMRIIDRRGTEIRRFTADMFRPLHEIASITPIEEGWQITSSVNASDPYTRIELFSPILAQDINYRNLLRCLLSWSYLSLMLWILLLAVLFTFFRPISWRDMFSNVGFMAAIALMFSVVGNRGLIKNSVHYSRFSSPALSKELNLEIDLNSSAQSPTQLFYDVGKGINEADSVRRDNLPGSGMQTIRFPLPLHKIEAIRYDPRDNPGSVRIHGVRVVDSGQRTRAVIPLVSLHPTNQIANITRDDDSVTFITIPGATDPTVILDELAIAKINQIIATASGRPK